LWALPSVLAYLLASLLGPGLTRWLPAGRVVAAGLAAMAAGFAVLALAGAVGLPAVVAGTVIFSVGLAPAYILSTDLVVSAVRPERAGMAAAVTETGTELGGALGIAVLGSMGVAIYRHALPGTLVDAITRAATLPPDAGTQLRLVAQHAYGNAFVLMSLAAAAVVAVGALLAAVFLRPAPNPAPEESYEARCVPLTRDGYDLLSNR
jgi:DHA2 family multidrug resistance protein-like MFS transporter